MRTPKPLPRKPCAGARRRPSPCRSISPTLTPSTSQSRPPGRIWARFTGSSTARSAAPSEPAPPPRLPASLPANLAGPSLLARHAVSDMRRVGWGRIVHVSTGLVEDGFPANAAYGAAKSGLHGLTRFMSRELARAGIFTNLVMAGFTPAGKPFPAEIGALAAEAAATKRVTEPDDVARAIVFLCSSANSNITGELVRVDGHFLAPLAQGAHTRKDRLRGP